jgi:hypothetical protein
LRHLAVEAIGHFARRLGIAGSSLSEERASDLA